MFPPAVKDEIKQVIFDSGLEVMQHMKEHAEPEALFVNKQQLKALLSIGSDTLEDLIANGLPAYKIGRSILFKLSEVEKVITDKYRIY